MTRSRPGDPRRALDEPGQVASGERWGAGSVADAAQPRKFGAPSLELAERLFLCLPFGLAARLWRALRNGPWARSVVGLGLARDDAPTPLATGASLFGR